MAKIVLLQSQRPQQYPRSAAQQSERVASARVTAILTEHVKQRQGAAIQVILRISIPSLPRRIKEEGVLRRRVDLRSFQVM
jgi:hypothetical protein